MLYAWQAQNTGGDTKKKCTSAMVFVGMCAGNVIGPLLYSTNDAPLYRTGLIADLAMFVTVGVISGYVAHSEFILTIFAPFQTGLTIPIGLHHSISLTSTGNMRKDEQNLESLLM